MDAQSPTWWPGRTPALQPTGRPHEVWAALPQADGSTSVGRYDTLSFTLRPLVTLSDLSVVSSGMWVDEPHKRVLFAYQGHCLEVALGD